MGKHKTVLLFSQLYPYYTGGMEVYNAHLANTLLKENDVVLITRKNDRIRCDNTTSNVFVARDNLLLIKRWGLGYFSIFISCLFNCKIRISEWKMVMIPYTSNFNMNAWPIILFSKLFRFKYFVHCHGGGVKEWKNPELQKLFFKNASIRAAVSLNIKNEYEKRTGMAFEYLPPLMPFDEVDCRAELRNKYNIGLDSKVILFVGSLKALKSPETLLKAFELLKMRNVVLLLAGDGELRLALVERYSNDNVIFLGRVPNERVAELYAIADIYVISSWFEGTPLSLLQAMNNGLCCIGSDVQGVRDIIKDEDNGLLFPRDDYKTLSEKLSEVLNDSAMLLKLGRSAKQYYLSHFNYDNYVTEIKKILEI